MVERIFSYGTLRLASVQRDLFGRAVPTQSDHLPGFRVDTVTITDPRVLASSGLSEHPILRRTGDAADLVDGAVLELSADELAAADAYEVDDYHRIEVTLASGLQAWVYVARGDT